MTNPQAAQDLGISDFALDSLRVCVVLSLIDDILGRGAVEYDKDLGWVLGLELIGLLLEFIGSCAGDDVQGLEGFVGAFV